MLLSCISRAARLPHSEGGTPTCQTQLVRSSVIPLGVTASGGEPWTGTTVPSRGQGEGCSTAKLTPWSCHYHLRLPLERKGHNKAQPDMRTPTTKPWPTNIWYVAHASPHPCDLQQIQTSGVHMHWGKTSSLIKKPYKKYYSSVRHS